GAESIVRSLGDAAHLTFTGRNDATEFLAIDIWTRPEMIAAFYNDPGFQQGAHQLFIDGLAIAVVHATDWYQLGTAVDPTRDGTWKVTELTCNGASQPLGDFHFEVRGGAGTFTQVFDPNGCVANYVEHYNYAETDNFTITADSISCNPNATCQSVIGALCLPA